MAKQIYLVTVTSALKRAAEFALRRDADVLLCDDNGVEATFTCVSTRRPEELQDCVWEVRPGCSVTVRLAPSE